jgi:NADH-ubiquinone oxidoreductase chain 1
VHRVFNSTYRMMERRVLGYIHIRRGPNKVGPLGVLQPFSDAVRLFTREQYFPLDSNYLSTCRN